MARGLPGSTEHPRHSTRCRWLVGELAWVVSPGRCLGRSRARQAQWHMLSRELSQLSARRRRMSPFAAKSMMVYCGPRHPHFSAPAVPCRQLRWKWNEHPDPARKAGKCGRDGGRHATRSLSPGSTARQQVSTVLDNSRQLDSLDSAVKSTASTALDSSRQLSTVRQRSVLSSAVKLSSSTVRQSRQLDSSTAEAGASMHELVAPLDGMALFEVHPSRKVSLDKCSHQGSAHWQQYALHDAPSHRGGSFRPWSTPS